MNWIQNNLFELLIILGLLTLAVEVVLLGFASVVLLAEGIALLITAVLLKLGLIPQSLFVSIAVSAGIAALLTAVAWKPLKRLQRAKPRGSNTQSDIVGLQFSLEAPIVPGQKAYHHYSGIRWTLALDPSADTTGLEAGQRVEVVAVDVGRLTVKAI
ncbi:MAG: activity regulator of membrane protease YbbK [Gammaproteobacteria bacterium]|nr:activity regulator of membrane protease YbbK [Gammaproteobacteria bacterium]